MTPQHGGTADRAPSLAAVNGAKQRGAGAENSAGVDDRWVGRIDGHSTHLVPGKPISLGGPGGTAVSAFPDSAEGGKIDILVGAPTWINGNVIDAARSEERRVGKECR